MKKSTTGLGLALFTLLTIPDMANSQNKEDLPPEATEFYEPVPKKIEAGSQPGEAPSDAIVLFNGTNLDAWQSAEDSSEAKWNVSNGVFTVNPGSGPIETKQEFGDVQLHLEWRAPQEIKGEGQGRGNSGVFLMNNYEVQVLDSYESKTYTNGQAGSIYKQSPPLVNVTKSPEEWNVYDIIFKAPRFNKDGMLIKPATVTVLHNGVLVQDHFEIKGPTRYTGIPHYTAHADKLPIQLQDHGNLVSFRNIWVRNLD
ncbi:3-keto-disaccharide hydrolase [Autumnicola psychrophila]|uniref:DUF1080 domain-containing protein n=1 Tax=Autumnicola psychrophila TaxID=3075592 RepID=A0ABU3DP81_9FLAO|nr:DUF1080 domain-containing protein [Zunongwangia sp. F225]MDT0685334.1 DUF1080 domain-containing protein [Zunongwangia sp. F225]